jgi:hypothetical protein
VAGTRRRASEELDDERLEVEDRVIDEDDSVSLSVPVGRMDQGRTEVELPPKSVSSPSSGSDRDLEAVELAALFARDLMEERGGSSVAPSSSVAVGRGAAPTRSAGHGS